MNFSEPFIRKPVMTVVLTLSVILFGVLAYVQLPVNDLPAVDYPVIQVNASYPGASPETVASNIATPLERQFMQINGLELVTSSSTQGSVTLTLQFALTKSIDAAATDVQTAISQATGSLPVDLPSPPSFSKTNPNDQPILYIAMTSDSVTQGRLYDYASTQVGQRISILPGVSRVVVYGTKSAIRIKADPSAMWARDISVDDLAAAVKAGTSSTGTGQLDGSAGTERPEAARAARGRAELREPDRRQQERRADPPARRRRGPGLGAGRAGLDALLDPGVRRPVGHGRRRRLPPGRRERRRGVEERARPRARGQRRASRLDPRDADLRPRALDRELRRGREVHADSRVRPGRPRHLPVPRPRDRHADSGRGASPVAPHDVHGDAAPRLQPRQPLAHGPDARDRLPRRRRDRLPREHRASAGARRQAPRGDAREREGDQLHDRLDDDLSGRRLPPARPDVGADGPDLPRVRRHDRRRDLRLGHRFSDVDSSHVRAPPERARPRRKADVGGADGRRGGEARPSSSTAASSPGSSSTGGSAPRSGPSASPARSASSPPSRRSSSPPETAASSSASSSRRRAPRPSR